MTITEQTLISAGVRNLKEFGYPAVDSSNILTDLVYSQFFLRMLKKTRNDKLSDRNVISICDSLIAKIGVR